MNCSPNYTFVLLSRLLIISKQYLYYTVLLSLGIYCYFLLQCNILCFKTDCTSSRYVLIIHMSYWTWLQNDSVYISLLLLYLPDIPYISKYYLGIKFHFHCNRKNLLMTHSSPKTRKFEGPNLLEYEVVTSNICGWDRNAVTLFRAVSIQYDVAVIHDDEDDDDVDDDDNEVFN
jgi:hypothetical protein